MNLQNPKTGRHQAYKQVYVGSQWQDKLAGPGSQRRSLWGTHNIKVERFGIIPLKNRARLWLCGA